MISSRVRLLIVALLSGAFAGADAAEKALPVLPPPPPPPKEATTAPPLPSDGTIEPEITITTERDEIHEEYRYNGVLYMVKIIPAVGPPYYLVYDDRGRARRSDLEPDIIVPQWVIKRF
jgi:hypothetical protein